MINPIFFLRDSRWKYYLIKKHNVSPIGEGRAFVGKISWHTLPQLRVEVYTECLIVIEKLKTFNTLSTRLYTQHNFCSRKLHFWNKPWRFILFNLLLFTLNIVIKTYEFLTWYSREYHRPFFLPHHNGFEICLILLTKSMRNSNAQVAHFSKLFQVAIDYWLRCVKVKC